MRVLVTGATGFIGSALVPELTDAGHDVVGLARSDRSAAALADAGAEAVRGSLDDLDVLGSTVADSDGVVHLAFKHEEAFSGDFPAATAADRRAIETIGAALEGTDRPLVIASGLSGQRSGVVVTEESTPETGSALAERMLGEQMVLSLADSGVRSASVRLAPTVHGEGDGAFIATLVGIAREKGVSGYVDEGRWPAVHRLDAASLFRIAVEAAPAGSVLHGVAEEGVPLRAIAEAIGRNLDLPVKPIPSDDAEEHFGWLASFAALDIRASSELTRERLGWEPTHPGLIEDVDQGHYFSEATARV